MNGDDDATEVCDDGRRDVCQTRCVCDCRGGSIIDQLFLVMFQPALSCRFHVLEDWYTHSNLELGTVEPRSH